MAMAQPSPEREANETGPAGKGKQPNPAGIAAIIARREAEGGRREAEEEDLSANPDQDETGAAARRGRARGIPMLAPGAWAPVWSVE
jgi:hypothetical protein